MISFVKFLFQLYIASGEKKWLPFMSWVEILNRLNYLRIGGFETALGIQLCNMKPDFKILSFQSPLCSSVDWLEYLPITMLVRRGGGRSLVAQHWAIISSHALSIDLLHTGAHLCLILFLELLKSLWVFPLSWLQCNLNSSLFTFFVWSWRLNLNVLGQHSIPELISSVHTDFWYLKWFFWASWCMAVSPSLWRLGQEKRRSAT